MKTRLILLMLFASLMLAITNSCKKNDFTDENNPDNETSGLIRNESDAEIIAEEINNILEHIRDNDMDYGNTYTNYSPEEVNGGYTITGSAYSGPIFTGSYTYEYIKKFDVNFNNYNRSNGTIFKEGSISYSFHDYSTSGYHLIIEGNSTSAIHITCVNEGYTINEVITDISLGDIDDSQSNIGMSFKSSAGDTYGFQGL